VNASIVPDAQAPASSSAFPLQAMPGTSKSFFGSELKKRRRRCWGRASIGSAARRYDRKKKNEERKVKKKREGEEKGKKFKKD